MKLNLVLLLFAASICSGQDLAYVAALGSKVYFAPPDTNNWAIEQNEMTEYGNYVLLFKHIPIQDSLGREIQPVMAFIVESVPDSLDVINYSIVKRSHTRFTVDKVLTFDKGYFSHRNTVGYEGSYSNGEIKHRVLIAHMRQAAVGLQVICDSTDGVYLRVENDMRQFVHSIGIDQ